MKEALIERIHIKAEDKSTEELEAIGLSSDANNFQKRPLKDLDGNTLKEIDEALETNIVGD